MNHPPVTLHVLTVDEWPLFREVRLQALSEAPYAFGSTLDYWRGEGDTEQRWRQRLTEVPFNAVARLGETPAGMASATKPNTDGVTELISMWVAPLARGKGVADLLIEAVICWAKEQRVSEIWLEVMEDNDRARAFYQRHGFVDQGSVETPVGARQKRRMVRPA
jgi:ribosomal protein S18 acetylase RimI-like enzyme